MNKKLFVVLVVVAAMLVTFSLVLAAKKAVIDEPTPVRYEKSEYLDKQSAISVPEPGPVEQQTADRLAGLRGGAAVPLEGTPNQLIPYDKTDLCDMYGFPAWYWTGWIWGLEMWANYQDPYQFAYGCADVFPCSVLAIQFDLRVPGPLHMDIRPIVFENIGTVCPFPGAEVCTGPVYGIDFPDAGWWYFTMDLDPGCCMYEPYFAGIEILSDHSGDPLDHIAGDDGTPCQSYNEYGGWYDCVVDYGGPGMILLSSIVMTRLQNECVEEPVCCQFDGYCDYLTPTECLDAGGTPAPDARYECIGDVCMLPWEGDTCKVVHVWPPVVRLLAGETAEYTVTVEFVGAQTECALSVDPDPPCDACVASFDPNPVVSPATTSTLTIVTDPTTPVGVYTFDINGAKTSAVIEVVAPSNSCEMYRDNESWAWFWSGWSVGDMQLMYFDPDELCPGCGADVYPFYVEAIKALIYNHQEAAYMDYIFHIYNSTGDPCDGPQEKLLSWEITGFDQWMTWTTFPLPEVLCVDGPFFFALEFNHDPGYYLPCALWTDQEYGFDCTQWVYVGGEFTAWEDMWSSPEGYMSLRAIGGCASEECPIVCDMQQDVGALAWFNSGFEEGDQVVKYYNPEDYCEPEVYPYKIHDLDFLLYDFAGGWDEIDMAIKVYLEVEDSCDGPGLLIYDYPVTITDFYGDMAHVVLDPQVCVYEPFYIGIEYLEGVPDTTPSPLFEDGLVNPAQMCHVYFYKVAAGYWIEHYDFWSTPDEVGYPIIRVSGFTNHPDCEEEPCDTVTTVLSDYGAATWIFAYPSTSGRNYVNQRFSLPVVHGGRLDEVRLAFYNMQGTPSPDVWVWWDDGNALPWDPNPPFGAIASFHIDNANVVTFPNYQIVPTWQAGLHFAPGQEFHVGYSIDLSQTGDTLSHVFDDYTDPNQPYSDRTSAWWPGTPNYWETFLDHYGIYLNMIMSAVICVEAPPGSTFVVTTLPSLNYIAPGDADADLFDVTVSPIVGYNLDVTLDIDPATLPAGVTYYYVPPSGTPEFTSDLYFSCDATVSYGTYILTVRGTGTDGQVKTKDISLVVRPPYDEAMVPFYGEGKAQNAQRATNFGAVGNDARDNFLWYGNSTLFDGSFVIATTDMDHMALDAYNCVFWGFVPDYHMVLDDTSAAVAPYNASRAFAEFGCDEAISGHLGVPGERDTVIIVGIDKADTVIFGDPPDTMIMPADFSIKIKIYYTEGDPIEDMYISLFEDWDVGGGNNPYNNWVDMDPDHNLMWQYWPGEDNTVYGMFKAPFYDDPMYNMVAVRNPQYVWPCAGFCDWSDTDPEFYCLDSLYYLMTRPGYFPAEMPDTDFSLMMTAGPITLTPGIPHIEIWIDFGRDLNDGLSWSQWWHRVLRYVGFYRGDVNASDMLEVPALDISDLVYLINYLFRKGPAPHPFWDQGDVNADGIVNSADIVYLINYVFRGGPPPKDCMRFIYPVPPPDPWCRPSLFENHNWD